MSESDKDINDLFLMMGRMEGKMDTFCDTAGKQIDALFTNDRRQQRDINSLLQTRRTQWKVVTLAVSGAAIIMEIIHRIFPSGPPSPPNLGP